MSIEILRKLFLWSLLINTGLLFAGSIAMIFMHDFIYKIAGRWSRIPAEKFDSIMYAMLLFYKILIIVFNAVPFVVLLLV